LTALEPLTGQTVWQTDRGCATIASAVARGNELYVPSFGLTALRGLAGGEPPELIWENARLSPSTSSPLWHEGRVYVVSRSVLKCADAESGKILWQLRLQGNFSSSPVVAAGHLYLFSEEGTGQIVKLDGRRGEVVGTIELGETILATPAIAGGALYVRSDQHLWKLARSAADQ
jgi:outer membrane protein assembly factor BamB